MAWWELTQEELTKDLEMLLHKQAAYYNTFYSTEEGRCVLLDMMQMCYSVSSDPVAMLARIDLFNKIRSNCGCDVVTDKAAIDAEGESIEFVREDQDADNVE